MLHNQRIGIIGAGNMGFAIAQGLIHSGFPKDQLCLFHPKASRREALTQALGVRCVDSLAPLAQQATLILLCVKPQILLRVLDDLAPKLQPHHVIVSIAAGVSLNTLAKHLREHPALVRVMPNTPLIVQSGMSALCASAATTPEQLAVVESLFGCLGKTVCVEEEQLDAVTGLSGSGPAYIFMIIDALADAGVKVGLSREISLLLASQTVYGSAKLLLESAMHPSQLKDQVTSPGGTAIEGIHTLEEGGLRNTLINAVVRATARSRELGKKA